MKRFLVLKDAGQVNKGDLTTEQRNDLSEGKFALPSERKYPIPDISHARNALARVAQHGTPDEKKKVQAAVYRAYPSLKPEVQKAALAGTPSEVLERVAKAMSGIKILKDEAEGDPDISERAQVALQAVVRILTPFKEELDPLAIHEVLDAAGFELTEPSGGKVSAEKEKMEKWAIPEKVDGVEKAAYEKAVKAAKDAFEDEVKKLGKPLYPDAQMAEKAKKEKEEAEKAAKAKKADDKEDPVEKSDIAKALDGMPTEFKGFAELLFKANESLVQKNAELTQLVEKSAKQVAEMQSAARHSEYVTKAASFKSLGLATDEVAKALEGVAAKSPELAASIEKMFAAANEQVAKGNLYGEIGSSAPGFITSGGDAWAKIEAGAAAIVAKSAEKVTKEQALDQFMQTPEGRRLYGEYQRDHDRAARQGA